VVGRVVGLWAVLAGTHLGPFAPKTLGDLHRIIRVSALSFHGLLEAYFLPRLQIREKPRLVGRGPLRASAIRFIRKFPIHRFFPIRPTCTAGGLLVKSH